MSKQNTIEMIKIIAKALGELNENAVFVGGATVPFYLPNIYASQIRPTEDIDVVMEIIGRNENTINEKKLRDKGFRHDTSTGAPICRWTYGEIKVDVMSSDSSALGFTNIWYKEGIERSIEVVNTPVTVKIFNLPCFIASKIEAFKERGQSDYRASSDMEDIISVLDASPIQMLEGFSDRCSRELIDYLRQEFAKLVHTSDFIDTLPGAVFNRGNETAAAESIVARMKRF